MALTEEEGNIRLALSPLAKVKEALESKDIIKCETCNVTFNSYFLNFKFCPICKAPRTKD